jgi:hypothetical protein
MKIKNENNIMTLSDNAIAQLIFGVIFAMIGFFLLFTVPFIVNDFGSYFSLIFVVAGGLAIAFWTRTTIIFDKNQGKMSYVRKGFIKKSEQNALISELASLQYTKDQRMVYGSSSSRSKSSSGPSMRTTETLTLISTKTGMIPLISESRDQGMISAGIGMLGGGGISKTLRKGQEISSFLGIPLTEKNAVAEMAAELKSAVGLGPKKREGQI